MSTVWRKEKWHVNYEHLFNLNKERTKAKDIDLKELAYAYLWYFSSVDDKAIDPEDEKNVLRWRHPEFPNSDKFKGVISPCINSPSCRIEVMGISQELVDLLLSGKAVPIPNPLVLQKDT